MGSGKKQTVGWRYFMGLLFHVCYGPIDKLMAIRVGDRNLQVQPQAESFTITLDKPDLFGGKKKEGGVQGDLDLLFGGPSQTANSYLTNTIGGLIPSFRNIFSAVFNKGLVAANNPYVKPWAFVVQRIHKEVITGDVQWYDSKAAIENADIVYEGLLIPNYSESAVLSLYSPYDDPEFEPPDPDRFLEINEGGKSYIRSVTDVDGPGSSSEITLSPAKTSPNPEINSIRLIFKLPSLAEGSSQNHNQPFSVVTDGISGSTLIYPRHKISGSTYGIRIITNQSKIFTPTPFDEVDVNYEWIITLDGNNLVSRAYNYDTGELIQQNSTSHSTTFGAFDSFAFKHDSHPSAGGERQATDLHYWAAGIFDTGIHQDMNPAHIIRECLVEQGTTGLGWPTANINDTDFEAAADTFFDEDMGLSFQWRGGQSTQDFINSVLQHCMANLRLSPFDGKWSLKPIRDDYTPGALTVYDEDNILELRNFQRASYDGTINKLTVIYRDALTNHEKPVTLHNLANIQAQGRVVPETTRLPGIKNHTLAARACASLLKIKSTPLAKMEIVGDRSFWQTLPGDVFKISWSKLGFNELIVRVLEVNYGSLFDRQVVMRVSEDVFGLDASSYSVEQATAWVETDSSPADFVYQQAIETPYYLLSQGLTEGDLASLDQDAGFLMALAAPPNSFTKEFEIWSKVGAASYDASSEDATTSATCTLVDGIDRANSSDINFTGAVDMDLVEVGDLAILGTGVGAEWCLVSAIDSDAGTATLARGVLDTTPQVHAAGTRLLFPGVAFGIETTERVAGQQVDVKLNPLATGGELGIDTATELSVTMDSRQFRPYPPGDIQIGGVSSVDIGIDSEPEISWVHRDRTLQTAAVIEQTDADVGPEAGVTYKLNFYDIQDSPRVLLDSTTGESGKTYTPTFTPGTYQVLMEIMAAKADGNSPETEYESWQAQEREFFYTETGRTLEDGTPRVTETNVLREQE